MALSAVNGGLQNTGARLLLVQPAAAAELIHSSSPNEELAPEVAGGADAPELTGGQGLRRALADLHSAVVNLIAVEGRIFSGNVGCFGCCHGKLGSPDTAEGTMSGGTFNRWAPLTPGGGEGAEAVAGPNPVLLFDGEELRCCHRQKLLLVRAACSEARQRSVAALPSLRVGAPEGPAEGPRGADTERMRRLYVRIDSGFDELLVLAPRPLFICSLKSIFFR